MRNEGEGRSKQVLEELPGLVTLYSDGSIVRHRYTDPHSPHYAHATIMTSNFTCYDITLNHATGVWARTFFPTEPSSDLPIVLHFHGGAFCTGLPSWGTWHNALSHFCPLSGAIWVSIAYRLAPENRLPVGFLDCLDALNWLSQLSVPAHSYNSDPVAQLSLRGNFRRIFLVGDSAGANLAYHVALQASRDQKLETDTFRVKGMVLLNPGFRREETSESERSGSKRALVDIDSVKVGARMALPEGENGDYFLMNPAVPSAAEVRLPPCLVFIGTADIFRDRQAEFCERMKDGGQVVEVVKHQQMGHCFFLEDEFKGSPEAVDLLNKLVAFIRS